MSDRSLSFSGLDLFYRQLIKSSIPLSLRNQLGDTLASAYRTSNKEQWELIVAYQQKFSNHLRFLRDHGYLPIDIPFADDLVSDLNSLDPGSVYDIAPGRRTEIITLPNVSLLPSVQKIMHDTSLHKLVSLYLGAPAHLHTCQAWWQYPMGNSHNPSNAQLWHRDRDDLSELKLFFYGTDVDASCGPHAYLPRSHTLKGLSSIFPSSALDNCVVNGSKNSFVDDSFFHNQGLKIPFKKWLGDAGTCFLEDTRGFHRAYIPTDSPRLLFSLVWTVGPGF